MTSNYAKKHDIRVHALPKTRNCKVVYVRGGVNYSRPINPTPVSLDALQVALLKANIAMSQVVRVEPI